MLSEKYLLSVNKITAVVGHIPLEIPRQYGSVYLTHDSQGAFPACSGICGGAANVGSDSTRAEEPAGSKGPRRSTLDHHTVLKSSHGQWDREIRSIFLCRGWRLR